MRLDNLLNFFLLSLIYFPAIFFKINFCHHLLFPVGFIDVTFWQSLVNIGF